MSLHQRREDCPADCAISFVRGSKETRQWSGYKWPAEAGLIGAETVLRFDHAGGILAIYRRPVDRYSSPPMGFAPRAGASGRPRGEDDTIERPKHHGLFNYQTDEALGAPVCIN